VTAAGPGDPIVALNEVLDEVLDLMLEVRQADRKVPPAHELHGELDQLISDLVSWRTLLADEDIALGVSPLSFFPTAAGRTPPNPWAGTPTDDEVSLLVGAHLRRLEDHLNAVLADPIEGAARRAFAEMQRSVQAHCETLRAFRRPG
jgi:hypothetical protein